MHDPGDGSNDRKWRAALAPLREAGPRPPHDLENRVTRAVRARRTVARRTQLALAAMLLVALGGFVGRWWTLSSNPSAVQPRYLLLLFEGPGYDSLSSSHEARVAEYGNWARDLARQGRLVDAAELDPAEQRLGPVPAGTSGGHLLAGMFIVRARDEAEALAIAATCPHLKHGGGVSVRPMRSS